MMSVSVSVLCVCFARDIESMLTDGDVSAAQLD